MRPLPQDLEPAPRDPKKLALTAWILVGIMLLGGFLVLKAYNVWSEKKAGDDRPAIIYRINKEKDLRLSRQDGEIADLFDLNGKVLAVNVISLDETSPPSTGLPVMDRLAAKYADNGDFVLVSLLVDPLPAEDLVKTLAAEAERRGMKLPQWWLGSNEPKTLHKFIKNELKTSTFPHQKDGRWIYDTSIVLIDRTRHIRRAVVPQKQGGPPFIAAFDFDQAAGWDGRGVKTGTGRSNLEELEALLHKTIDELLAEPAQSP